jgi:hypothetical protein
MGGPVGVFCTRHPLSPSVPAMNKFSALESLRKQANLPSSLETALLKESSPVSRRLLAALAGAGLLGGGGLLALGGGDPKAGATPFPMSSDPFGQGGFSEDKFNVDNMSMSPPDQSFDAARKDFPLQWLR